MTRILATLFAWPNGIVVGNLIASFLWAAPAFLRLDRRLRRQHAQHMAAMARLHTRIRRQHAEHMNALRGKDRS